ncbi:Sporulation protein YtxC [Caldalkalibacillus thermarum TA2.A1]|uniref:Sporulation protein YtxC n=1 Tax=Caldalkalibacillus thermarum (strain TA2.A1) TaxID=986075 RepID=F5L977_CALTT|nr:putative sporulation protein YtxC [Caldalkalibacillus thermarum]EGL82151.1 Sporulation protein YtxC [Caldalkalibacillus thermarum TA2.A1]QZT34975.1 putative sporulation protein YtxC [Caldalkalibacillus thermarum TA2.A1]
MFIIQFEPGAHSLWNQEWMLFVEDMYQSVKWFEQLDFDVQFEYTPQTLTLRCLSYPERLSTDEARRIWQHVLGSLIADFVVDKLEDFLLVDFIQHTYGYRQLQELSRLYLYCDQLLNAREDEEDLGWLDEDQVMERKQLIYQQVYTYLSDAEALNLQGFFQFRLKAYCQKLLEAIECAIDEYVLDQEYDRFLQLLRLFVRSQMPKCALLHVVHIGQHLFHVFDQNSHPVSQEKLIERLSEWTGSFTSQDELIISALISYLPRRIILHTPCPDQPVIRTLQHIFSDRLTLCTGCEQCDQWKREIQIQSPELDYHV